MYEDDRSAAIAIYDDMFNMALDESALCDHLVSPTRQAVLIARAYNSNPRKLSVYCETKTGNEAQEEGVPGYVQAIDGVRDAAYDKGIFEQQPVEEPVDENQITLFDDEKDEEPAEEKAGETEKPSAEDVKPEADDKAEAEEPAEEVEESSAEAEAEAPVEEAEAEAAPAEEEPADEVDAFMKDFSIAPPQEAEPEAVLEEEDDEDKPSTGETERRAKVFPLVLYIVAAVPLTILGIALLLVPTVLFLAIAAAAIVTGVVVLSAAFGGFSVFADIMAIVGGAIVLLAVGILALWTFIWFVGGAIVGLVRGVFALGGKWCFKEVQV